MPAVSIGIPTYNRASTLPRAIDSALAQDLTDLEVIISDNASTDGTEALCQEYCRRDARVKYFRQPQNLGLNPNFMNALAHASGEYFMWLSDDDWLDAGYLSECVRVLRSEPHDALVCPRTRYYDHDGNYLHDSPVVNALQDGRGRRLLWYFQTVGDNAVFYGLMRRQQLNGVRLHERLLAADWLLVAALAFQGRIRTLPHVFFNRTVGGVSVTLASMKKVMNMPHWQIMWPGGVIASNAFRDILWHCPVYQQMPLPQRFLLASAAAAVVVCKMRILRPLHYLLGAVLR